MGEGANEKIRGTGWHFMAGLLVSFFFLVPVVGAFDRMFMYIYMYIYMIYIDFETSAFGKGLSSSQAAVQRRGMKLS